MKSKRFLTILLSMAIMLTFMPAMAFAAEEIIPEPDANGHRWVEDAAKTIAATCQHDGILVDSCYGEPFGDVVLPCEAIRTDYQKKLTSCTPKANPIQLSKADYLVRLVAERGYTEAQIKTIAESNTKCYVFAYECKDCGRIIPTDAAEDWQEHKRPNDTPPCAISFVCEFCGQTVYTGIESGDDDAHNYEEKLVGENWCSDGTSSSAGYNVYEYTCTVCGDKFRAFRRANSNEPYTWQAEGVKHENLSKIEYRKADCQREGEYAEYCSVCGMTIRHGSYQWVQEGWNSGHWEFVVDQAWRIPKTDHDYNTVNFPATCTTRGYTKGICKVCGATVHKEYTDDELGHDYVVKVRTEPNCDAPGITQIYCSRCDAVADAEAGFADKAYTAHLIKDVDKDGYVIDAPEKDSKLYLVGLTNEFVDTHGKVTKDAIEIKDWKQGAHDWGQYESMTVADCTHGGFQAKKCKICGHFDPHTAKETGDPVGHKWVTVSQDPTCGAKGFTVQRCAVCGEQNGPVVRWGAPKVSYGAKCDFSEWVVETEPTPFKEGTKKLICSVCGDDGHLSVKDGEVKETGVTRTTIAKTKIAAPKVKAGKKKAVVTVKAVEGAVKYQIKVNGKVKKTVTKAGKVTIKKLKGGKKAKFQIVAINDKGVKAASKVKTVKIKK